MKKTSHSIVSWPFIGQELLGQHLMSALDNRRLAQVLLFIGPRALGKAAAARWLIQRALCGQTANRSCGQCASCRQVSNGSHPEAQIIDPPAGEPIGIDIIRQALQTYATVNWHHTARWLLMVDAERLTESASNTMLKFMEELPPGLRVVLTTAEPQRLLSTLRSRASIYRWHTVTGKKMAPSTNKLSTPQQAAVARAVGRPGWYQTWSVNEAKISADRQQALATAEQIVSGTPRSATGSALMREQVFDNLKFEELIVRELLLLSSGVKSRLLWPTLRDELTRLSGSVGLSRMVNLTQRWLARYDYSSNVQPRMLYEDLHLV